MKRIQLKSNIGEKFKKDDILIKYHGVFCKETEVLEPSYEETKTMPYLTEEYLRANPRTWKDLDADEATDKIVEKAEQFDNITNKGSYQSVQSAAKEYSDSIDDKTIIITEDNNDLIDAFIAGAKWAKDNNCIL